MTIERVQPQFGLQAGVSSGLSTGRLGVSAVSAGVDTAVPLGAPLQNARVGADQFGQLWQDRFMVWGARESASAAAIRLVGNVPTHVSRTGAVLRSVPGINPAVAAMLDRIHQPGAEPYLRTYGELFHLGNAKASPFNWQNYTATVKTNFEGFTKRVADAAKGRQSFFNGITPKTFLKETVWEANARAIREIPGAKTWGERMPGLSRLFGVGMLGFNVLKSTKETYDIAKAQEDGSLSSKARTLGLTAKTFAQKTLKNVVAWEVAGAAAAFGHALALPGLGGILAPIAIGALAGAGAIMLLNKLIKEPEKPASQIPATAVGNPFQRTVPHMQVPVGMMSG